MTRTVPVTSFWTSFRSCTVEPGTIAVGWLGQAGFVFKDSANSILAADPYLTDSVERIWGFKRLMASVAAPEEFSPDILAVTHFHEDHLDIDAMPAILNNGKTLLLAPSSCIERVKALDVPASSYRVFNKGDTFTRDGLRLEAVYADHGDMVPDPIGVLIEMEGIKIYLTGDTAYVPESMKRAVDYKPDLLIAPVNGANDNMNGAEAARLAKDCGAKAVIPCHFWTFAEHLGNPQEFKDRLAVIAPDARALMMCQGEIITYR
ncbi:MAG: MBL fold metallo-hydrolase [Treponema sp.]|jgi:L-ascorbate 6-phosphate lactonase|nr:MBL fold metallo-hydrolase [Treponema sp.]